MVPDTDSLAYLWRSMLWQAARSGALVVAIFAATSLAFFVYGEPLLIAVENSVWLLIVAGATVGAVLALLCLAFGSLLFAASLLDRRS